MHADVQAYFDAKRAADPWDALKQSTDPLVAYIANHTPDQFREQAEATLRALPQNATEAQLRQAASGAGVTGYQLDAFIADARNAGVFGDAPHTPGVTERAALETWARGVAPQYVTDRHIAELFRHVDAIVAAEAPGYEGDDTDED